MTTSQANSPPNATSIADYGFAEVGTYGLAHSLLAWARCRLWCDDAGKPMLAPSWLHVQHRIGPLLRRERDNRQYHRLFHFPGYVTGLRRLWLLARAQRVEAAGANASTARDAPTKLLVFRNLLVNNEETHFRDIVGRGAAVRTALAHMTKPAFRPVPIATPHVALHVRMGDFRAVPSADALRAGAKNARIPLEWYCDMLTAIRARLGRNVAAVLYSDGADAELAPLLSLPEVRRSPRQPSIGDLLSMSQGSLLISSGSGFSMWGSFLGTVPRLCYPGQRLVRVLPVQADFDLEPEIEFPHEISPALIDALRRRLNS